MAKRADRLQRGWEVLIAVGAIVAAIDIPARIVLDVPAVTRMTALGWVLTVIFLADMLPHLRRAVLLGRLPCSGASEPASRRPWLWLGIDLCAVIPFSALPVPPVMQLLRLLKLARVAQRMWSRRRAGVHNPILIRSAHFVLWLAITLHWLACGWLALRGFSAELAPAANYVRALYFCVTTVMTVGYGDITPATQWEMLYAMMLMVLGVGVFSYVIGNVAGFLTNMDPARVRHREVVDRVTAFMRYRQIPVDLQRRILDFYEYLWEKRLGYDESTAIAGLPPTLRAEVSLFLNRDIIQKVPLFRGASEDFIQAIALALRPIIFMPGDPIMRAGEPGEEMYFISRGTVEIVSADSGVIYATLAAGDFFGEIALVHHEPRTASARAVDYCDLYSLTRVAFDSVLCRHPDVAARIRTIAEQRRDENEKRKGREEKAG